MSLKNLFVAAFLFSAGPCFAGELAAVGGLNFSRFDNSLVDFDNELGIQLGVHYYHPLAQRLSLRTGGLIVQRNSTATTQGTDFEVDLVYLDIPLTVQYQINPKLAFFGGIELALLLSDDCSTSGTSSCVLIDTQSLAFGLPLGVNFALNSKASFDFFYQIGLSEVFNETDWASTFGANFLYRF